MTECTSEVNVFTVDTIQLRGRIDRHTVCDINKLDGETKRPGTVLDGSIKFGHIFLDYCWFEDPYYDQHLGHGFFHRTILLLISWLEQDGMLVFPLYPLLYLNLQGSRHVWSAQAKMRFLPSTEDDKLPLVKGTDDIDEETFRSLGKDPRQQELAGMNPREFSMYLRTSVTEELGVNVARSSVEYTRLWNEADQSSHFIIFERV